MRGYQDVLCHAARRAIGDGDVERLRQVVIAGDHVESPSASLCQMRQAEAFFRADFPAAIVHGKAAVEAARQAGDLACWASMLGLLYVAEAGLGEDPDGALAHAEDSGRSCAPEPCDVCAAQPADDALRCVATNRSGPSCSNRGRMHPPRPDLPQGVVHNLRGVRGHGSSRGRRSRARTRPLARRPPPAPLVRRDLPHLVAAPQPGRVAGRHRSDCCPRAHRHRRCDRLVLRVRRPRGIPRLTQTIEELGPDVIQAARVRSETRSYDESMQYVFDSIDNLIAATTAER